MNNSVRGRVLTFLPLVFLTLGFAISALAQSSDPSSNTKVQELYAEAKAAQARGDLAGASAKYESLLEIAPTLGAVYNNLGALYLEQRRYSRAAAVLKRGLATDPKMTTAHALLGISLYEMGSYPDARRELEEALRSNSSDDRAELFLANDLIKLDELDLAASRLRQLSERQPNNQEIWYLLGIVHMKLSQEALAKLNEIDPDSVWVHEISGEIMEDMKNYDGAIIEYKKAVESAPLQPGTHYLLGDAYWLIENWEAAAEQFHEELENDPKNCAAQWKLGNILIEQHLSPEEALVDVDKALAVCPALVQARADRARALLRLDRDQEALQDLQAAERASPDESSIHFLLAQAYRALGRTQEAQSQMIIFSKLEESSRAAVAQRAKQVIQNQPSANPPKN